MRPLLIHSSSKARSSEPRRVLHIEYRLNSATVSGYPCSELDSRPVFPPIRGRTHNTPDPAARYPHYCPGSSGATYPIVTVSVLVRPAELMTINTNW